MAGQISSRRRRMYSSRYVTSACDTASMPASIHHANLDTLKEMAQEAEAPQTGQAAARHVHVCKNRSEAALHEQAFVAMSTVGAVMRGRKKETLGGPLPHHPCFPRRLSRPTTVTDSPPVLPPHIYRLATSRLVKQTC